MSVSQSATHGDRPTRYLMRERLFSIGDDFWIETEHGERAFKVDAKTLRIRDTIVLETVDGEEVFTIEKKLLSLGNQMQIERDGKTVATVKKALFSPLHDRFSIDVEGAEPMEATGKILDYAYTIERSGHEVAEISRKWLTLRDSYGIEIPAGEDAALMLAVAVCIDHMTHDRD